MAHIADINVGDVVLIEPGDSPPADGVLISCHGIRCDESSATGESDHIDKMSGDVVWSHIVDGTATREMDPFIISGTKVLEGLGSYLVTNVGKHSTHGRIMASLQIEDDPTPLQVKLGRLASWIGWLGSGLVPSDDLYMHLLTCLQRRDIAVSCSSDSVSDSAAE